MKKNNPKSVSIIITTYNWPEALKVVIESVLDQTHMPDEIIIIFIPKFAFALVKNMGKNSDVKAC